MLEFGLTALLGLSVVFAFAYTSYQFFRILGKAIYVLSGKPEVIDLQGKVQPVTGVVQFLIGLMWGLCFMVVIIFVYYITVLLSLLGTYIMSLLTGA